MSLRVWLPLIEDFTNQGISDLTPTLTTGNTFTTPGKIGNKSLHLTQLQTILPNSSASCMYGAKQLSYAYWVKVNTAWSANWLDGIRWIETDGSATATARQEFYTNCTLIGTWYKGGSISGKALTPGEWTHLAATFDYTTGTVKFYINGTLVGTTTNLDTTYHCRGDFYIGDNGVDIQENDVRIYDHCLSTAEVREIAQGLVLHYKLDGGLFGNSNLLLNTHFDNRYNQTTGWDTTKNGTLLAYSWGGYNPGVANQATCYHAHLKLFNNEYVYEYIKDTETWLGISQGGLQSKLIAGKTYTFSCEQYSVTNTNYMYGGLYYYKTGATSAGFHLGYINCNTNRQQNTWQKYTYTFTAPSDGDYSKNMIWYCYGHSGGTGTFYLRHLKLEEGNAATPWCPADSELDIDRTIVEDSSGYNHNGTLAGAAVVTSETPRYNVSTHFSANNQYIHVSSLTTSGFGSTYTFAWWEKRATYSNTMAWGFQNGIRLNGLYNGNLWNTGDGSNNPLYKPGTTTAVTVPTVNVWHHFAMVADESTCKVYQDGELWAQAKTFKQISGTSLYINGWDSGTSYKSTDMSVSDFRLYATQLLDTDIKQLYNIGMKVDKLGNVHTNEFVEKDKGNGENTQVTIISQDNYITGPEVTQTTTYKTQTYNYSSQTRTYTTSMKFTSPGTYIFSWPKITNSSFYKTMRINNVNYYVVTKHLYLRLLIFNNNGTQIKSIPLASVKGVSSSTDPTYIPAYTTLNAGSKTINLPEDDTDANDFYSAQFQIEYISTKSVNISEGDFSLETYVPISITPQLFKSGQFNNRIINEINFNDSHAQIMKDGMILSRNFIEK